MFKLPTTKEILTTLPEPVKGEYKYRTVKLNPGTNYISTSIKTSRQNPLQLWISAVQHVYKYEIIKGKMEVKSETIKAPSWDDLKMGYYTSDMKHISLASESGILVTDKQEICLTFFGEHTMTPPEDGLKEITGIDNEVWVTFLDSNSNLTVGTGGGLCDYADINEALAVAVPGATIKLKEGVYDTPITLNKSVTFVGEDDTILTGKIEIAPAPVDDESADTNDQVPAINVTFRNISLEKEAVISAKTSDDTNTSLTLDRCYVAFEPTGTGKIMGISAYGDGKFGLKIKSCIFANMPKTIYNLIDITAKLTDGSSIIGNKFYNNCCSHNIMSLYGVDENANIHISNNYAYKSSNLIRIGFKGDPTCRVYLKNNKYDNTDVHEWAGMLLVQPYNMETLNMSNTTIYIENTIHTDGYQVAYLWRNEKTDMKWTDENKPVFYLDGKEYDMTGTLMVVEPGCIGYVEPETETPAVTESSSETEPEA